MEEDSSKSDLPTPLGAGLQDDDGTVSDVKNTISQDQAEIEDVLATAPKGEKSVDENFNPLKTSNDQHATLRLRQTVNSDEYEVESSTSSKDMRIIRRMFELAKSKPGAVESDDSDEEESDDSDQGFEEISAHPRSGECEDSLSPPKENSVTTLASEKVNLALSGSPAADIPYSELFRFLLDTIRKLEADKLVLEQKVEKRLQPQDTEKTNGAVPDEAAEPKGAESKEEAKDSPIIFEEFHVVSCNENNQYFRDVPRKFKGDVRADHLRGHHEVENGSKYLERNPRTAFAICSKYNCDSYLAQNHHSHTGSKGGKLIQDAPIPERKLEYILTGAMLRSALITIINSNPERFDGYQTSNFPRWYEEPYLMFYQRNKAFVELVDSCGLDEDSRTCVRLFCLWLEDHWRQNWDECDELLSRGRINYKHYTKLFRPNEIVVTKVDDEQLQATKIKPYPWRSDNDGTVDALQWTFNGKFVQRSITYELKKGLASIIDEKDGEKDITSLATYPLRLADEDVYDRLCARGEKFWTCRKPRFVCYKETDDVDPSEAENRFMIDYEIYRRMHGRNAFFSSITGEEFEVEKIASLLTPDGDFFALLPPHIHAFNMQAKLWMRIRVDRITDVTWNKDAFKQLVVPEDTKEQIQALVTAQTRKTQMVPDIIAGKGNGLLILLHGAPGTGKTLTAESIAELEERPLYRITCGDIGTEPDDVERYLGAALQIGRAWDCVVLLDEADVFIEERSLKDLKRNAMISVFLRIVEYYNGILILTTNRVGIFDEAFKSRIQLALRYPNLDQEQRREIWCNFFGMLRKTKELVDIQDLEMNVGQLATVDLNGRQIRNAVTTARHLAKFRKERLVYRHIQRAIASIQKFDEYLLDLSGGVTDERWARETQLR